MLLKDNKLESTDDEEVLDLLVDKPISIDIDNQEKIMNMNKGKGE